jgi:hypothetical protein
VKTEITFWKNRGHETLRGKTVELFKVSWKSDYKNPDDVGEWVRDEDGPYWGMYKLGTEEVRRLTRDPNSMGVVVSVDEIVEDAISKEVDRLEAEDVTVTPEGLDQGEED